jgi:hypothetical protein
VLYVSGFANQVAFEYGSISPSVGFLQKPFAAETLAMKVRERFDHHGGAMADAGLSHTLTIQGRL